MSRNTIADPALSAIDIKKTVLATSISLLVGGLAAPTARAALPTGATLNFNLGQRTSISCTYGTTPPCNKASYAITDVVGSYFVMDTNGNGPEPNEKTPIGSLNGIVLGTTQAASGSHPGSINGTENPDIDNPWTFFGGTGMHQTTSPVTDNGDGTMDLSGWNVTWNGIPSIPVTPTEPTTITCDPAACSDTSSYTLDGAFEVSGAGFTGVSYFLHLEGSVSLPGGVPVAVDDSGNTIVGNPLVVDVTANDTSADPLIEGSVAINTQASNGTAVDNPDDTVTYTPDTSPNFVGTDTFVYTIDNANGTSLAAPAGSEGAQGIVTIDVQTNEAPVAVEDALETNTVALEQAGGSTDIEVLTNDTDSNNDPGLPGGIDVTTLTVTNVAGNIGTCTGNADGTITYSQALPSVTATDSCTYTVIDIDTFGTPLQSNVATLTISVAEISSDWPTALPDDIIPVLNLTPGADNPDQSVKPEGSWFSMQVSASQLIYTSIEPGPDGGFVIGYDQPATGSHTGSPNGTEQPGYTDPWVFFSNTGFDLTRNGGIEGNTDGTLEFRNRFLITWNSIAAINLGGSTDYPDDLGFATIVCNDKPCQHGSTYTLEYAAHVQDLPDEPASGFDGVAYQLFQEGTVSFLDGNLKVSNGTVTNQTRMAASEVSSDDGVDLQCVGSCFDYTIENVTNPSIALVLPLAGGVPNSPVWRILDDGVWRNFDTSAGDSIKSAAAIAGADDLQCPEPDDPAYMDLSNDTDANVGHQCIQLTLRDNGLNDLAPADGTISDPGGLGTAGVPEFEDLRTSDTSGCSIAAMPVNPTGRGDWWLLASVIGLLGWVRKRVRR